MPKYRVVLSRTRTIYEHAVVVVDSSSAQYAERAARRLLAKDEWTEDLVSYDQVTASLPEQIGPVKP